MSTSLLRCFCVFYAGSKVLHPGQNWAGWLTVSVTSPSLLLKYSLGKGLLAQGSAPFLLWTAETPGAILQPGRGARWLAEHRETSAPFHWKYHMTALQKFML